MSSPASPITPRLNSRGSRIAVAGFLAACVAVAAIWFSMHDSKGSLLLTEPIAAMEALGGKSIYCNAAGWGWLRQRHPELLQPADRTAETEHVRSLAQAVQNPKLFRQLDRQDRYDALFLVGAPGQYRPLLDHLLNSPDWTLSYLDHQAMIFRRSPATPWNPTMLEPLRAKFAEGSARENAIFLSQTAGKLLAIHKAPEARELLDAAEKTGARVADIPQIRAQYHLGLGEWREALAQAEAALKIDSNDLSAAGSKVQALYSTKRFNEAYALSRELIKKLPDDPAMLFYHAKIAHEARAFEDEAKSLRTLIAIAQANERPVATYRVYLGQSLASSGDRSAALQELGAALSDPDLPKDQRNFANDCIDLLRSSANAN